jgi:hypothetical protein
MEPDGAANGERRRMMKTPHDKLRAASAEGLACRAARVTRREALDDAKHGLKRRI